MGSLSTRPASLDVKLNMWQPAGNPYSHAVLPHWDLLSSDSRPLQLHGYPTPFVHPHLMHPLPAPRELEQLAFSLRQDYFRWSSGPVPQNQLAVGRRSTQPEHGPVAFDQVHVAVHAEVAHPNIEMTMGGLKQWQQRHQFMCKDLISMWRANLRWRATVLARAWCVWNCGPVTMSTRHPSGSAAEPDNEHPIRPCCNSDADGRDVRSSGLSTVNPRVLSSWLKWRDQFSMNRGMLHWICYRLSQSWVTLRSSQRRNKIVIGSDLHWLATHLITGLAQWRGMVAQNAHYKHRLHQALIHWLVCSLSRTVWWWRNTVKVSVRQQLIFHNATLLWRAKQLSEAVRCWIAAAVYRHSKQSQMSVGMAPPVRHHTDRGSSQLGLVESVLVLAGELRVTGECIVQPLRGALSARQRQAQLDTLVGSGFGSGALQGLLGVLCAENALQMCGGRIEGSLLVVDQLSQCIT